MRSHYAKVTAQRYVAARITMPVCQDIAEAATWSAELGLQLAA